MTMKPSRRRSVLAVAGVTAGVASVVVAPSPANAQAADPEAELREWGQSERPARPPAAEPSELATCNDFSGFETPFDTILFRPTTTPGDGQTNCQLVEGSQTPGVFKLEDALQRCYGLGVGATADDLYTSQTAQAVKQVQEFHGLPPTSQFGPETSAAMFWPEYGEGGFSGFCSNPPN